MSRLIFYLTHRSYYYFLKQLSMSVWDLILKKPVCLSAMLPKSMMVGRWSFQTTLIFPCKHHEIVWEQRKEPIVHQQNKLTLQKRMSKASRALSSPRLFTAAFDEGKTDQKSLFPSISETKSVQVRLSATADVRFEAIWQTGRWLMITKSAGKGKEKNLL